MIDINPRNQFNKDAVVAGIEAWIAQHPEHKDKFEYTVVPTKLHPGYVFKGRNLITGRLALCNDPSRLSGEIEDILSQLME